MSIKKNILIIVESIDVNDSSGTKGRVSLIKNLHKAGFQLKVYHYTRKEVQLQDIECVSIKEQKRTLWYLLSKLQLILRRVFGRNMNPWIEKQFGFSFAFFNDSYSMKKALQEENPTQFDWVLTLSKASSFRTHKAVLGMSHWHAKWLAYVHDPYPMHFYPRPYTWVEPGYYKKQEFFREVSKKAAHAVFPSLLLKDWMGSYYPDFLERGFVIPHQITRNDFPVNTPLPDFFHSEKFTIVHAGSLMKQRDPRGLVEGYALFLKNNPAAVEDSQLLFLGNSSYHSNYLEERSKSIPSLFVSNVYVAFETAQKIQQDACINVILEAKAEISPFLPGKFPHCVEAGKPILHLGPALSETRRLLGANYPYTAEIDETERIVTHIQELYAFWQKKKLAHSIDYSEIKPYLGIPYLKETLLNVTK